MTTAPQPYEQEIDSAAAQYGVPVALLRELIRAESGFQPNVTSPAGAQGIAQLMPATSASLGVNPFDPAASIGAAAHLLSSYLTQYGGSVDKALAAYNAGPGAVQQYGGVPPYPETRSYVSRIMAAAGYSAGATVSTSPAFNPFSLPGDLADTVVQKIVDAVWSVGRPVLLTGALVTAGGVIVALGLWRAVQRSRPGAGP